MADNRKWPYASNQFANVAAKSDENGMKQILFHDTLLKSYKDSFPADTDYSDWYTRFNPLRIDAESKYTAYYTQESAQEGKTENVDLKLKAIKGKYGMARDWYNRVAAIYAVTNPARFTAIYPNGLKPFYKNGKDKIISALSTLSQNIGTDANLLMIDIKAEVDAQYNIINPDRDTQKIAIATTGISRSALTGAITAALDMQFGDLGLEINKFRSDPDKERLIKSFHDLEIIQSHPQKIFNVTFTAPLTKDLVTRTMVFNSRLRAKATGGEVKIYLATTPGGTDSTAVTIADGQNKKFTAADFHVTDYGVSRHITVVYTGTAETHFTLQLY